MARPVRTIRGAAAFVRRVGIASLFPMDDLALPSLWAAVSGTERVDWGRRDEDGKFTEWTPEFERVWRWKSELPERCMTCVGKHLGSWVALVSLDLLPALYSLTGRSAAATDFTEAELSPSEREVAEAIFDRGPLSLPRLRAALDVRDKRIVEKAIDRLQRLAIATTAGAVETGHGWPALTYDLVARRYADSLAQLPAADEGRVNIARSLLHGSEELSVADLKAITHWRKATAEQALDALVSRGEATVSGTGVMRLWVPRMRTKKRPHPGPPLSLGSGS